jgi:hypothetical protein
MGTIVSLSAVTVTILVSLGSVVSAQGLKFPRQVEANPQVGAIATGVNPEGVSNPALIEKSTQGFVGAESGCRSVSAKMTNGFVESCAGKDSENQ